MQITDEADRLVKSIAKTQGQPFNNKNLLLTAVGNVISGVLFGRRFDGDDEKTHAFYDKMDAVFRFFGAAGVLNIFPFLRIFPNVRRSFSKVIDALEGAAQFIADVIKHHEECMDSTVIRDYTDAFIKAKSDETALHGNPRLFTGKKMISHSCRITK